MGVVTKTGDDGKSRWNNQVVDKDSALLEAVGTLDELMSVLGVIIERGREREEYVLVGVNRVLYRISGELTGYEKVDREKIEMAVLEIEGEIETIEKRKGNIKGFLEAGRQLDANLNLARTVCRRAERRLVSLNKVSPIDQNILKYINRLSDYLFVEARKE